MNKAFRMACVILVVLLCFVNVGNTVGDKLWSVNAEIPPKTANLSLKMEEYIEFFRDFVSDENHEYRRYTFYDHSEGDPSHFIPYIKEYGLPVLTASEGEWSGEASDQRCFITAERSSGELDSTLFEYWCKISGNSYHVDIRIHGDAIKDHYNSLTEKQKLRYLKKEYRYYGIPKLGLIGMDKNADYSTEYRVFNIGGDEQPCSILYIDKNDGKKDIIITMIKGNMEIWIKTSDGVDYQACFSCLEKLRVDIMTYDELIAS